MPLHEGYLHVSATVLVMVMVVNSCSVGDAVVCSSDLLFSVVREGGVLWVIF